MKWDLTKIYKTEEEFNNDINFVKEGIAKFASYQGKLSDLATLTEFMEFQDLFLMI